MQYYRILDQHTGSFANATRYTNLHTAHRAADRLDNAYGAVRYTVIVWSPTPVKVGV